MHFRTIVFIIKTWVGECSSVGRASDCGSEGRGFDPHHSPHESHQVSKKILKCLIWIKTLSRLESEVEIMSRGVAQFGSALALGARGCQFESGRPDHFF